MLGDQTRTQKGRNEAELRNCFMQSSHCPFLSFLSLYETHCLLIQVDISYAEEIFHKSLQMYKYRIPNQKCRGKLFLTNSSLEIYGNEFDPAGDKCLSMKKFQGDGEGEGYNSPT